jgi:hypothetical protein
MATILVWNKLSSSTVTQMSSHLSNQCYRFGTTDICCAESRLLFTHKQGNPLAYPTFLSNSSTVRSIIMLVILPRIERYLRRYFESSDTRYQYRHRDAGCNIILITHFNIKVRRYRNTFVSKLFFLIRTWRPWWKANTGYICYRF